MIRNKGDSMKKLRNMRGYTLVEILATITILGILSTTAIIAYNRYRDKARVESYDTLAQSAVSAMEEYIMDNPEETSVTFEELYEKNYLEEPIDSNNPGKKCEGKVSIKDTTTESNTNLDINDYEVNLCCNNYNYTYTDNGKTKSPDEYCKAHS